MRPVREPADVQVITTQNLTAETRPTVQREWVWPAADHALDALPTGALTVIRIRDRHPGISWAATVRDLIGATLSAGNPVSYVAVGGFTVPDIYSLCELQPQDGFGIILDTDLDVAVPGADGHTYNYPCGIPTLDNINSRVGTHEQEHGNSLLVLDGVEAARPFATAEALLPPQVPVTPESLDLWRAEAMRYVAEQRSDAPTVLVWHEWRHAAARSPRALDRLLDVAHVVVDHVCLGKEGDVLAVLPDRARPSICPTGSGLGRPPGDSAMLTDERPSTAAGSRGCRNDETVSTPPRAHGGRRIAEPPSGIKPDLPMGRT